MVFSTFVKHAKAHTSSKPQFFESSYPYLKHYNALVNFETFFQKTAFGNGGPHPSNTSDHFFAIDTGHYGLYCTIFNQEGDKRKRIYPVSYEERDVSQQNTNNFDENLEQWETFFISKVARETQDNVKHLQVISKRFLSPTQSPVKPLQYVQRRFFSQQVQQRYRQSQKEEELLSAKEQQHQQQQKQQHESASEVDTFSTDLMETQINTIRYLHENATSAEHLDSIYPIYQSLKRNDMELPTIELYNIVLASILDRACENSLSSSAPTLPDIESRLTKLLTVYQELITSSSSSSSVKPNELTYSIVIDGLFAGAKQTIDIFSNPSNPQNLTNDAFAKSQEFLKIATDLFVCLDEQSKDLKFDIVEMVTCLNVHPNLLSPALFKKLRTKVEGQAPAYYVGMLSLVKHLGISNKEEAYKLIQQLYGSYKTAVASHANETSMAAAEYPVYSSLVQALIATDNLPYATKFVDDIINDHAAKSMKAVNEAYPSKADISLLVSAYLKGLADVDLMKAYEYLEKFNRISFIPEFTVDLYNDLINRFIQCYRQSPNGEPALYEIIWKLHNYVAIRKDYHLTANVAPENELIPLLSLHAFPAREALLSLSIDIGDHSNCFLLIKELLLKNHMFKDFNVFRKLISYLHNGAYFEPTKVNNYYFELLWNIIEQQSKHYMKGSSSNIQFYLSGVVQFLVNKVEGDFKSYEMLLHSEFIAKSFQRFRLETDNIYGVMNVARDLIKAQKYEMRNEQDLQSLLQLQSHLINELEDTDTYYLELSSEILEFKQLLRDNFVTLIGDIKVKVEFSKEVLEACKNLNMEQYEASASTPASSASPAYMSDISFQLNVNYNAGILQFIDLFQKGNHHFNYNTWKIVINSQFVSEILQLNDKIQIDQFIERMHLSALPNHELNKLLIQLIELNNERVNIAFFKFLLKSEGLRNDNSLISLLKFWREYGNENLYLKDLVTKNFESVLLPSSVNKKRVLSEYMKSLTQMKEFGAILNMNLELSEFGNFENDHDLLITECILNAHLEEGNLKEFDTLFRSVMNAQKQQQSTNKSVSTLMKDLLIKYFTYKGSFGVVLKKFGMAELKKSTTRELVFMNMFLNSLEHEDKTIRACPEPSVKEFTYQLISSRNLEGMQQTMKSNNKFFNTNKDEVIMQAFDSFVQAGSIAQKDAAAIQVRFQTFLSFLKLINFTKLSTSHLIKIISLYSLIGREDLLNILLNKLAYPTDDGTYNISPMLDYYFFEISLYDSTKLELSRVFNEYYKVFTNIKDKVNADIINDLCQQYKIALMEEPIEINSNLRFE